MSKIPVIDFQAYGPHEKETNSVSKDTLKTLGNKLIDAFRSVGFCYLTNHGINEKLIHDYMRVSREFFESPTEVKRKYVAGSDLKFGWLGFDQESVNPDRPADLKESFLYSPFQELPEWPSVKHFESLTKELHAVCAELGYRLLDVLSYGLELPVEVLQNAHKFIGQKGNTTAIRSLYYPPIPTNFEIKSGQARLGEHTDFGTVSFLFQDDVGGLEILHPDEGYVKANPIPGTIVVNLGSLLQRLTSDSILATMHRVLIPQDETRRRKYRQSIVFFFDPDSDYVIKCLDGSNKYEPIKTIDFLIYRFKRGLIEYSA